jgi:hypothetical protein
LVKSADCFVKRILARLCEPIANVKDMWMCGQERENKSEKVAGSKYNIWEKASRKLITPGE